MLIRQKKYREWHQGSLIAKFYWDVIREEFSSNGWLLLACGNCDGPSLDFKKLAETEDEQLEGLTEWYLTTKSPFNPESDIRGLSPFASAWKEILGNHVIPFDLGERRQKFHRAFDILKDYIAKQEKLKKDR